MDLRGVGLPTAIRATSGICSADSTYTAVCVVGEHRNAWGAAVAQGIVEESHHGALKESSKRENRDRQLPAGFKKTRKLPAPDEGFERIPESGAVTCRRLRHSRQKSDHSTAVKFSFAYVDLKDADSNG